MKLTRSQDTMSIYKNLVYFYILVVINGKYNLKITFETVQNTKYIKLNLIKIYARPLY